MNIDTLIAEFDKALRTVCAPATSVRPLPGADLPEADLNDRERAHVAALMRINHSGEVCAQALYQGQALTARDPAISHSLASAGAEETEHLAWTERRIHELGGRKSLLNPLWYAGSLTLGVIAGRCGDAWNLGFLAETERQVGAHLDSHQSRLPAEDLRSQAILKQMSQDEAGHAATAVRLGARELPSFIKHGMKLASRVMTGTTYYL